MKIKEKIKNIQLKWLVWAVLIVLIHAMQIMIQVSHGYSTRRIVIFIVLSCSLHSVWSYYLYQDAKKYIKTRWLLPLLFLCNMISIILLYAYEGVYFVPIGVLGSGLIYVLCAKDISYSVLFYHLSIILLMGNKNWLQFLIIALAFGITIIIEKSKKTRKNIIRIGISMISIHFSFILIFHGFDLRMLDFKALWYIIMDLCYIGIVTVVCHLNLDDNKEYHTQKTSYIDTIQTSLDKNTMKISVPEKVVSRDIHEHLLRSLREHSEEEFYFARFVAMLSNEASKVIGARNEIVQIGSLYHRIGVIYPGNYIENGMKILKMEGFSSEVIQIVKEHNLNYSKPTMKESMIVMLTISIVHTLVRMDILDKSNQYHLCNGVRTESLHSGVDNIVGQVLELRYRTLSMDKLGIRRIDLKNIQEIYTKQIIKLNDR